MRGLVFTPATGLVQKYQAITTRFNIWLADQFGWTAANHDTTVVAIACHLRGTRIMTAQGERPIGHLAIGARRVTASGARRPIRFARGAPIGRLLANRYRADLEDAGIGLGRHGFVLDVPPGMAPGAIRLHRASDGAPIARSVVLP